MSGTPSSNKCLWFSRIFVMSKCFHTTLQLIVFNAGTVNQMAWRQFVRLVSTLFTPPNTNRQPSWKKTTTHMMKNNMVKVSSCFVKKIIHVHCLREYCIHIFVGGKLILAIHLYWLSLSAKAITSQTIHLSIYM